MGWTEPSRKDESDLKPRNGRGNRGSYLETFCATSLVIVSRSAVAALDSIGWPEVSYFVTLLGLLLARCYYSDVMVIVATPRLLTRSDVAGRAPSCFWHGKPVLPGRRGEAPH